MKNQKNSQTLTVNTFFWFATRFEGDNSNVCGNQMRTEGWVSPISYRVSLVITRMPKQTFSGYVFNSDTEEKIYLDAYGISTIITAANKWITENI